MSSRRNFARALKATAPGGVIASIPGFAGVAGALMYWSILFWEWVRKNRK